MSRPPPWAYHAAITQLRKLSRTPSQSNKSLEISVLPGSRMPGALNSYSRKTSGSAQTPGGCNPGARMTESSASKF